MASNEFIFTGDTVAFNRWALGNMQPGQAYRFTKEKNKRKRTLDQNGQLRVWYEQIARELPEDDLQGWERYCKLHHGIPILRADDMKFKSFYDMALKNLSYENKLMAMDYTPVTRWMKTDQINRYFEAMQSDFLKRGVSLEFLR